MNLALFTLLNQIQKRIKYSVANNDGKSFGGGMGSTGCGLAQTPFIFDVENVNTPNSWESRMIPLSIGCVCIRAPTARVTRCPLDQYDDDDDEIYKAMTHVPAEISSLITYKPENTIDDKRITKIA